MLKKGIAVITVMGMVVLGGLGVAWAMEWSPGMDCSGCHSAQVASQKDKNLLSSIHADKGVTCIDCHKEEVMKTQHKAAFSGAPVTKLKVNKETCFNCHMANNKHKSYDEVAKLTAQFYPHFNPHDAHVGQLECRACHHMHKESQNKCSQCHTGREWPWKQVP